MKFYTVKFLSLPKILFAVEVDAGKYCNSFIDRIDFIEISLNLSGDAFFRHINGSIEKLECGKLNTILPDFNGITYSDGNKHITFGMNVKYENMLYDTDFMSADEIRSCISNSYEEDTFLIPYRNTPVEKFPFFYDDVSEISRYYIRGTAADLAFCKAKVFHLLAKISLVCSMELLSLIKDNKGAVNRSYCESIKDYIEKHINEKITLDSISHEVGISKNHLCRIFKSTEQITVNEYITNYRLELCKTIVAASNIPIHEICEKIGICDEYYLCRLFKRKYGIGIKEYRTGIAGGHNIIKI